MQNTDYQMSSQHVWWTLMLQFEKPEKGHQERELLINPLSHQPPNVPHNWSRNTVLTLWDNDLICSKNAGRAAATLGGENHLYSFPSKARSKTCFQRWGILPTFFPSLTVKGLTDHALKLLSTWHWIMGYFRLAKATSTSWLPKQNFLTKGIKIQMSYKEPRNRN